MKTLKLAALASMIAATSAYALESMTDTALSDTTGQDGLTITVGGSVSADYVYIHDNDGYVPADIGLAATDTFGITNGAGAITLSNNGGTGFSIKRTDNNAAGTLATIYVDADGNGTGSSTTNAGAVLNVNIKTDALTINTGEIGVARSNRVTADTTFTGANSGIAGYTAANGYSKILDNVSIKLGALNTNIQLGSSPQGSMIKLTGAITGGLSISDLAIYDNNGATGAICAAGVCGLKITGLTVLDNGTFNGSTGALGADLTVTGTTIDIGSNGLQIKGPTQKLFVGLESVIIGNVSTAASIGDVVIGGLDTSSTTIAIAGH